MGAVGSLDGSIADDRDVTVSGRCSTGPATATSPGPFQAATTSPGPPRHRPTSCAPTTRVSRPWSSAGACAWVRLAGPGGGRGRRRDGARGRGGAGAAAGGATRRAGTARRPGPARAGAAAVRQPTGGARRARTAPYPGGAGCAAPALPRPPTPTRGDAPGQSTAADRRGQPAASLPCPLTIRSIAGRVHGGADRACPRARTPGRRLFGHRLHAKIGRHDPSSSGKEPS